MKTIIFLFFSIAVTFCSYSQIQYQPVDSSALRFSIENEKKAYDHLLNINTREASVASENFDVNFYRCEWNIDPAVRLISGNVTSYFTITQATSTITFELSDTLTVDSIRYRNTLISFQRIASDGLVLQFPTMLNQAQKDSVTIFYKGVPKTKKSYQPFLQFFHAGTPVISTLSEPYGAKEWWPCKNGLTDKADSIEILITSPVAYKGVTNGVLLSDETIGSNRTLHYKHRYPIASYLVGISVTNYSTITDNVQIGSTTMPVVANYYSESIDRMVYANYYASMCLKKFSQLFGDYPFIKEQYAQTQWSVGGGMEHQTNSFISSGNGQLIAHELGHQWFGDMVTCGSWQHIWLNEGFADYMQYIFVESFDSTIKLIHLNAHLNLAIADSAGSIFVPDTTNPSRIFDNHSYYKGGYVLHMLRGILGDSLFFRGIKKYLGDPAVQYGFARTADLQRNFEQVSGKNLQTFFTKWIYGEGYPNYRSNWYQNNNQWARVQINQTTTHPSVSFYEMPVQLRFKNNARDTIITVNHQYSGQVFWINPGFTADSMFIDPNLWLLAKERVVTKEVSPATPDYLQIYPNPAPDILYVSFKNPRAEKISIRLCNIAGQVVYKSEMALQGRDELIPIPLGKLAHGVYIISVATNKNILATKKIVK